MSAESPVSWKRRALAITAAGFGALVIWWLVAHFLHERRIDRVEVGMELAEVEALLGRARPISAFDSELTRCPPERQTVIFQGNPSILLNGSWEDYVKVGVVDGTVCDVARMSL